MNGYDVFIGIGIKVTNVLVLTLHQL